MMSVAVHCTLLDWLNVTPSGSPSQPTLDMALSSPALEAEMAVKPSYQHHIGKFKHIQEEAAPCAYMPTQIQLKAVKW